MMDTSLDGYPEQLEEEYRPLFDILVSQGFSCFLEYYAPEGMGGFIVECRSSRGNIRVSNDKGQIFVEFETPAGEWREMEELLKEKGLQFSRYPSVCGIWTGYELQNRVLDLRQYLPELIQFAKSK